MLRPLTLMAPLPALTHTRAMLVFRLPAQTSSLVVSSYERVSSVVEVHAWYEQIQQSIQRSTSSCMVANERSFRPTKAFESAGSRKRLLFDSEACRRKPTSRASYHIFLRTCGVGAAELVDHAHALLGKLLLQLALAAAALRPLQGLLLVASRQNFLPLRQSLRNCCSYDHRRYTEQSGICIPQHAVDN